MTRFLKGTFVLLLVLVCGSSIVLAQPLAPQDPNAPATSPSATPTPVTLIVTVTEPTPNEFDVTWKTPSTDALGRQIVTFTVPEGYDVADAAGGTYDPNTRLITWVLDEVAGNATDTSK